MNRVLLLALPAVLAACTRPDPMTVLTRFDPAVTTVPAEAARISALKAADRVTVTPGQYCAAFEEERAGSVISGRLELTLTSDRTYQYADRYVYQNLVRSRNETGAYTITGHGLTLVSGLGTERTLPLTSATREALNVWGATPLTRAACTADPVTGQALRAQRAAIEAQLAAPVPWTVATSAPDLRGTP
ncbi:hypothetical protein [Deinococcus soli (ex Cha et al. 2016)]|uniref:hypothetical protein n=1 Tax=Deinococcus soli (ex Cha et al. 2016) TaxID=1309411 RepID=UPI0016636009|nr:hypothetical protein [Deinococcus soli (ex Cha et al. 2016)]GGB79422.1 hypothetical protein GCM10008019_39560 [Deinococcus soli (ex Cha et al. 2016)]